MRCSSLLLLIPVLLIACGRAPSTGSEHGQAYADAQRDLPIATGKEVHGDGQLTEYVRRIFQDSKGHHWFGSNGDGVYRYDGSRLEVFSTEEGLAGYQVTGILEDRKGRIWISTNGGVSRYDGRAFVNFTTKDGLSSDGVWSILEARDGTIWVGTQKGPCRFDPSAPLSAGDQAPDQSGQGRFIPFALPTGDVTASDIPDRWVFSMAQDRKGDLWFGTDAGAFRYDGRSFQWLTANDGLGDNTVPCILVDRKDQVWFSSMTGGLSRFDGRSIMHFTAPDDIGDNEVWNVYEDRQGNIWFGSEGYGVYRYDPSGPRPDASGLRPTPSELPGAGSLKNFSEKEGLGVLAVQSIYQDKEGKLWFGGGGGLYRLDGDTIVQVKRNGPW